jgi:hypothetical protein
MPADPLPEPSPPPAAPAHVVRVFEAEDLYVTNGANLGDGLGGIEAVCPGDIYELAAGAVARELALAAPAAGAAAGEQVVAAGSAVGAAGDRIAVVAQLTLMAPDGDTVPLYLLRHRPAAAPDAGALYALPLAPVAPRTDYALLRAEPPPPQVRLADLVSLSFLRGTRVTLAGGALVAVEALRPGDLVLTRDHGAQPLRWIGQATLRARGQFAPVLIAPGAMGNEGVLGIGPHHRLFLYLRDRPAGLATAEILVQARHFVDGARIVQREGGFADWFSLVFDRHEIIYAEGIPVESLMVTEGSVARLPEALAEAVRRALPGLSQHQHFGTEAGREAVAALRNRQAAAQPPGAPPPDPGDI